MGDREVYDHFDAAKELGRARRKKNWENSVALLIERGVEFSMFNEGRHLKVRHGDEVIDFWPSTGLWSFNGTKGRGVFNLLKILNQD